MHKEMRINQLKTGVVLNYCAQAVHILTGLLYTPIMLRLLGQSEYGLYQLVSSVVSYLSLLSLGFSTGYVRFYSRYKVNGDQEGIAKLNGMYGVIFSVITVVCLLCGGIMVAEADLIFGDGLSEGELEKARILMAMLVFNLAITFVNSVFSSHVSAHEEFVFLKAVELLRALFNPFLALPLLIMGYGSVGMVAVTSILTMTSLLCNVFYSHKKLHMRFSFRHLEFGLFREMGVFTFYIFINMVVDQINWSVDKFLLGRMMGTAAVAVYGVAGQLNTLYQSLSLGISSVFTPRVNRLVFQEQDNKKLDQLLSKVGRIQFIVLALVLSGFVVFGREFIHLWAGGGYDEAYSIALLLMGPVTVPLIQNLGIEIQRAKNKHKARSIAYLFIAVGNIILSIPLIYRFGATGAAAGTAICLFMGNIVFMNLYYHLNIRLNMVLFWREIARLLPAVVIATLLGLGVMRLRPCVGWIELIVYICAYTVAYSLLLWHFGMNKAEKDYVRKPLSKMREIICGK